MKQLQRNDLKIGTIYVSQGRTFDFLNKIKAKNICSDGFKGDSININKCENKISFIKDQAFSMVDMREATPEEKYWLEECIKADKFISKEEALKTFTHEYVELKDTILVDDNGKYIGAQSSEGAVFQIGDKITPFDKNSVNKGKSFIITGFRWNNAKTEICAITDTHKPYGIRLSQLELYVEPKQELSLLEQAKLRYPIGTKFRVVHSSHIICKVKDHENYHFQTNDVINLNIEKPIDGCFGGSVYYKGEWAEIVEDFVLPKKWCIKRTPDNYKEINKFCNENKLPGESSHWDYTDQCNYIYSEKQFNNFSTFFRRSHIKDDNFTEITFEQFKKHVLNEKV